jgi:hypothetical protein
VSSDDYRRYAAGTFPEVAPLHVPASVSLLDVLGVDDRVVERWGRELERCFTDHQARLTQECHRLELIIRRMCVEARSA